MNETAVDECHAELLRGLVMSLKPERVLELGYGTGRCTRAVLEGLRYNRIGKLTLVDNWWDFGGTFPTITEIMTGDDVTIITSNESAYVHSCPSDSFDLIVSDADHQHAGEWFDQYIRICRNGGMIVAHDTANTEYPGLAMMKVKATAAGLPWWEFSKSSREGERCWRGLTLFGVRK